MDSSHGCVSRYFKLEVENLEQAVPLQQNSQRVRAVASGAAANSRAASWHAVDEIVDGRRWGGWELDDADDVLLEEERGGCLAAHQGILLRLHLSAAHARVTSIVQIRHDGLEMVRVQYVAAGRTHELVLEEELRIHQMIVHVGRDDERTGAEMQLGPDLAQQRHARLVDHLVGKGRGESGRCLQMPRCTQGRNNSAAVGAAIRTALVRAQPRHLYLLRSLELFVLASRVILDLAYAHPPLLFSLDLLARAGAVRGPGHLVIRRWTGFP
eukprot:CAMPEP_0198117384 /NCGR_PEP_ID=MMETSP1442-20131203/17905_1 /TAXON_ID= /ORGANISM="Craspedostauros australis, Strain CCMP3328" /LENGTH=268 /DNA_ID=CAMNT_0043775425 /DNA_START=1056 /DNA_END=1857 /DNA_ORIENTATION=+